MMMNTSSSPGGAFNYISPQAASSQHGFSEGDLYNFTHTSGDMFDILSSGDEEGKPQNNPTYGRPPMDSITLKLTDVTNWLRLYYTPSVIGLGVFGNAFSTVLLLNTMLASLPNSRYLAGCTIVDGIYLVNLLLIWFSELGYPVFSFGVACHATTFISKVCAFLSLWYTVSYSVHALIVIKYPNAERQLSTIFKAKLVCLVFAIVAIVVFLNISLLVTVINLQQHQACIPLKHFAHVLKQLDQLDVFINFLLPYFSSACICMSCAVQCYKDGITRRRGPHRPPQRSIHVECDVEAGLNCLYFTFSLTHLVLTLPLNLMNAIFVISGMTSGPIAITLKRYLAMEIMRHIYHLKFASNVLVFLLAWKGFRRTVLVTLLRRFKCLLVPCRKENFRGQETRYVDYSLEDSDMMVHSTDVKVENGNVQMSS